MSLISASVGRGGRNIADDVRLVQRLLNVHADRIGIPELDDDGDAGPKTKRAIDTFQRKIVGFRRPDGRVDPGGKTLSALIGGTGAIAAAIAELLGSPAKAVKDVAKSEEKKKEAPPPAAGSSDAPWLAYALAEKRRWEDHLMGFADEVEKAKKKYGHKWHKHFRQEEHTTMDEDYFAASPYWGGEVHARGARPKANSHWCAAFVNWCLHRAGYSHTGLASAKSFTKKSWWKFRALDKPKKGCVIVVERGNAGHVAFFWEQPKKGSKKLLGGNQGQRITISGDGRKALKAKDSYGKESPYLWPERGTPTNCNHEPPTEHEHYCWKGSIHKES